MDCREFLGQLAEFTRSRDLRCIASMEADFLKAEAEDVGEPRLCGACCEISAGLKLPLNQAWRGT